MFAVTTPILESKCRNFSMKHSLLLAQMAVVLAAVLAHAENEGLRDAIKDQLAKPHVIESITFERMTYSEQQKSSIIKTRHFARWQMSDFYMQTLGAGSKEDQIQGAEVLFEGRQGSTVWSRDHDTLKLIDRRHNTQDLADLVMISEGELDFADLVTLGIKSIKPGSVVWDGDNFEAVISVPDLVQISGNPVLTGRLVVGPERGVARIYYHWKSSSQFMSRLDYGNDLSNLPLFFPRRVTLSVEEVKDKWVPEVEWKIEAANVQLEPLPDSVLAPKRFQPNDLEAGILVFTNNTLYQLKSGRLIQAGSMAERTASTRRQRVLAAAAVVMMFVTLFLLKWRLGGNGKQSTGLTKSSTPLSAIVALLISSAPAHSDNEGLREAIKGHLAKPLVIERISFDRITYSEKPTGSVIKTRHFARWQPSDFYLQTLESDSEEDQIKGKTVLFEGRNGSTMWSRNNETLTLIDQNHNTPSCPNLAFIVEAGNELADLVTLGISSIWPGSVVWDGDNFEAPIALPDVVKVTGSHKVTGRLVIGPETGTARIYYRWSSVSQFMSRLDYGEDLSTLPLFFPRRITRYVEEMKDKWVPDTEWRITNAKIQKEQLPNSMFEPKRFRPDDLEAGTLLYTNNVLYQLNHTRLIRLPTVAERSASSRWQRMLAAAAVIMMFVALFLLKWRLGGNGKQSTGLTISSTPLSAIVVLLISTAPAHSDNEALRKLVKDHLSNPPTIERITFERTVFDHHPPYGPVSTTRHFGRCQTPNYYVQFIEGDSKEDEMSGNIVRYSGRFGHIAWERNNDVITYIDLNSNSGKMPNLININAIETFIADLLTLGIRSVKPGSLIWNGDKFEGAIADPEFMRRAAVSKVTGRLVLGPEPGIARIYYQYNQFGEHLARLDYKGSNGAVPAIFPYRITVASKQMPDKWVPQIEWIIQSAKIGEKPLPDTVFVPERFKPDGFQSGILLYSNDIPFLLDGGHLEPIPTMAERNVETSRQRAFAAAAVAMMVATLFLLKWRLSGTGKQSTGVTKSSTPLSTIVALLISTAPAHSDNEALCKLVKEYLVDPPVIESITFERTVYERVPPFKETPATRHFARWQNSDYYIQTIEGDAKIDQVLAEKNDFQGRQGDIRWMVEDDSFEVVDLKLNTSTLPQMGSFDFTESYVLDLVTLGVGALRLGSAVWRGDDFEAMAGDPRVGIKKISGRIVGGPEPDTVRIYYHSTPRAEVQVRLDFRTGAASQQSAYPYRILETVNYIDNPVTNVFVPEMKWEIQEAKVGREILPSSMFSPERFNPRGIGKSSLIYSNNIAYYSNSGTIFRLPTYKERMASSAKQRIFAVTGVVLMCASIFLLKWLFGRRVKN